MPNLDRREVSDTPVDRTQNKPILILNPAYGNEPYILATAIGREVSKKFSGSGLEQPILVLPLLYGERQNNILLEENPNDAGLIYYDEQYGEILQSIKFGSGNFSDHLNRVNRHYDEVDNLLNSRYRVDASNFSARSLATRERIDMSPKNIIGTIDVGARVSLKTPHRYFAFPMLLSELLQRTEKHPELGFSESDMRKLTYRMLQTEAAYSQVYIPWINTFSYDYSDDLNKQPETVAGRSRVYTPAMKQKTESVSEELTKSGVIVMFSGTGSALEANKALIQAAHNAGIEAYSPPWIDIDGAEKLPLNIVFADKKMLAVLGRSGWGTGWQAFNLGLPWLVTEYQHGDDPEIYFNNKTIEALKLGKVIGPSITSEELTRLLKTISPGLLSLRESVEKRFGTLDGIDFIANHLFKDYLHKSTGLIDINDTV